jgi:rubrerythrin
MNVFVLSLIVALASAVLVALGFALSVVRLRLSLRRSRRKHDLARKDAERWRSQARRYGRYIMFRLGGVISKLESVAARARRGPREAEPYSISFDGFRAEIEQAWRDCEKYAMRIEVDQRFIEELDNDEIEPVFRYIAEYFAAEWQHQRDELLLTLKNEVPDGEFTCTECGYHYRRPHEVCPHCEAKGAIAHAMHVPPEDFQRLRFQRMQEREENA